MVFLSYRITNLDSISKKVKRPLKNPSKGKELDEISSLGISFQQDVVNTVPKKVQKTVTTPPRRRQVDEVSTFGILFNLINDKDTLPKKVKRTVSNSLNPKKDDTNTITHANKPNVAATRRSRRKL